ncbi:MAG: hypothetical protein K2X27_07140 [Candidatus Obscuribacterales bacterium]|nr:hypothetical protein [Candidatus Obscuribacterales bacterium]
MFNYTDLKKFVYIGEAVLGLFLIIMGGYTLHNPISDPTVWIMAIIIVACGMLALFFSFETYILRDDPEIWR